MNEELPSQLMSDMIDRLDLDDYEDVATGIVTLVNPKTGQPTASTITLASKDHPVRRKIDMARTRKLRTAFNQTGKLPVTDPVDEIDDETDYLVASTLGWELTRGGQAYPFSPDNARTLYTDPKKQWVRTQVLAALNKIELFIANSAKP